MLDTVNFKLTRLHVEGVNFIETTPPHLNPDTIAVHSFNDNVVITGDIGGLKVSISPYQVRVKDGSLCKWLLGDNFQSMGRGDVKRAIEKLSDVLHLPMERATITRLDIAENIITRYPPPVYLNHLGVLAYATRLQQPHSLYYQKRNEKLCFYDKIREQRDKRDTIPDLYNGQNVLRYEQRYTGRLGAVFKVDEVTGAMLYDEGFYISLLQQWLNRYRAIRKVNDVTLNFQAMTSKQKLYKMGVLAMVERVGGEVEMIAEINEAQKRGELTPKQAYDLRQAIKDACKAREGLTVPSEAITELDKKISEAVRYYR